jgi:deoxycytidylate deaminase
MSAVPKQAANDKSLGAKAAERSNSSQILEERQSQELVIAFMGAVGCGMPGVITTCETLLEKMQYRVVRIKLSDFIKQQLDKGNIPSDEDNLEDRYLAYQKGGNFLRQKFGTEVFGEYAINKIQRCKISINPESTESSKPVPRVAYLIDQIKHPDEAKLLRLVYRKLLYIIGVMSTFEHRKERLIEEGLKEPVAAEVMRRDRKEAEDFGQQLEKAFKCADYFIHNPQGNHKLVETQLSRFLELSHGHNGTTPTKHEYAMYVAHSTALKSGCLSRQVGAAITDVNGRLISSGANDVPRFGGGLYSEDSPIDHRCFKKGGKCENLEQKKVRKEGIRKGLLEKLPEIFPDQSIREKVTAAIEDIVNVTYTKSGIPDLIEFSRAVHAEMDAIVAVSRGGVGSTVGGSLYTTTFPCHNCARHIIAAGIRRVYYIEPYEKSLAPSAHDDAIIVLDHDEEDDPNHPPQAKVKFIHFSGVAPNLYPNLFLRERGRKNDDGDLVYFDRIDGTQPRKIVKEYLDSYRAFESKIAGLFDQDFPPDEPILTTPKLLF